MSATNQVKTILWHHDKKVQYDQSAVIVDDKKVDDLKGLSSEEYARNEVRKFYNEFFSAHFENLIVLTGAGSSVDIGKSTQGKAREALWKGLKESITEDVLKELCKTIKYNYPEAGYGDVEAVLSKAEKAKDFKKGISKKIDLVKKYIKEVCTLELPVSSPHQLFVQKITSRKLRDPRVKVFTLNYDTLFEQAAAASKFTLIDGFSYSFPRVFNGACFDHDFVVRENSRIEKEENYVPRVMHLYKLHGSLDWMKQGESTVKTENVANPSIVYPNYEKYEVSYEQPFFEMMLRFQQSLRKENVMLLSIGFSFYDKHVAAIIKEALKTNSSFRLGIITKDLTTLTDFDFFKEGISRRNLILIDETFEAFAKHYPYPRIYESEFLKSSLEGQKIE